jgi:tRNA threonylcarbamoyladenosine biosynthesis protein TsaE
MVKDEELKDVFKSESVEDTLSSAHYLIQFLTEYNLVCLYGELGIGKTTFVQGLAKELGIKKRVISPSFILQREYKIKSRKLGQTTLYHIDCYNIASLNELKGIDLNELWEDKHNLVIIEWADRVREILPKKRIDIEFKYLDDNDRFIRIVDYDFKN